ncbi:MAG: UDP-N-acetylglucosamine 2-epimerase [Clostridium sp.]|nr:UDP-N-acetylglucosamine 2-epimerase [Clostridium sp.]MCM1458782.1 UDP-N-acetylglucosamine 2-epimerase [Bacteroides sp.]
MADNTENKYQICVVTGTRAEYGVLKELLFKLRDDSRCKLTLVVTGSHLVERFGNTQKEIMEDGFEDYIKVPIPLEDDSKPGMAKATGVAMERFSELFADYKPDICIVLGDRFEIFAVAAAAHLVGIPVAHISGGDVTEGAVDDAMRHCITKLSTLHFPGCEQSAKRIIQMGEQPDSVFNVGEPGVENCLKVACMSRRELADNLNFEKIMGDYAVVTFHPVTMENGTAAYQLHELICAMEKFPDLSYIITKANADAEGRIVNDIWQQETEKHTNWKLVSSLGMVRYLSAVKYAKAVIGNSSSGIFEAPSMGTPTVNIGDRQKGRMMAESIVSCLPEREQIAVAIRKVLDDNFQKMAEKIISLYGDGTTSEQIIKYSMEYLNKNKTREKKFYDINFVLAGKG